MNDEEQKFRAKAPPTDHAQERHLRPLRPQQRSHRQSKRLGKSIKLDRVNPRDFSQIATRFFCDDCSHYDVSSHHCTMGYVPQHTRAAQMRIYELSGMMAFCRFLEID